MHPLAVSRCLPLCAALLGACWATPAAHGAAADPAVVLVSGDLESPGWQERAAAAYLFQRGAHGASPAPLRVEEALDDIDELTIVGDVESTACHRAPVGIDAFVAGLDAALEHVLYVQADEARATLRELRRELPCLEEVLPREQLARIAYLEGVALGYDGDLEGAREQFRRALVVDPALQWDPSFPPSLAAVFQDAVQDALQTYASSILVQVETTPEERGALAIDGATLGDVARVASLAAGTHLLQWQTHDGAIETRVVTLEWTGRMGVVTRGAAWRAAGSGSGGDGAQEVAREALCRLGRVRGVDTVYLVELGAVDLVHRFDVERGVWVRAEQGEVLRQQQARRATVVAGIATLVGSAAMVGIGLGQGLTDRARMEDLGRQIDSTTDAALATELAVDQEAARWRFAAGVIMAGVGGGGLAVGVPILVTGVRGPPAPPSRATEVAWTFSAGPAYLSLRGRF